MTMNVLTRFLISKMAAESTAVGTVKSPAKLQTAILQAQRSLVGSVKPKHTSREELKNIKRTVAAIKPKTEKEKKLTELTGKPYTKGQYKRYASIAGGAGLATHFAGRAIGGGKVPWLLAELKNPAVRESISERIFRGMVKGETMVSPRQLARAAVIGGIYGAFIPAARRVADISAAKRGKY